MAVQQLLLEFALSTAMVVVCVTIHGLGLFNLTNTMPSLVMPWFTLALVPSFGFSGLFLLFAGLALVAALLLLSFGKEN